MSDELDVLGAVERAMSANRAEDVIEGVKTAVAGELERLDPDAEIVFTDYFNHSYVPDMLVKWKESGKKLERRVYLRNSLGAMVQGDQAESLAPLEPVLLGLRTEPEQEYVEEARSHFRGAPRTFVTELAAVADLNRASSRSSDNRQARQAPLLDLVRGTIVRGGRGVLSEQDSRSLVESGTGSTDSPESLVAFQNQIDQHFLAPAASRLHEAIRLVRLGLEPDLTDIEVLDESQRLSDSELRVLIPYLLEDERVTRNRSYWAAVGSMMDLTRLEDIADDLAGLDLTPLVAANAHYWHASRSWLTIRDVEEEAPALLAEWKIASRLLAADIGPWRLFMTSDQRRLRGREQVGSARWDDVFPHFGELIVRGVELKGLTRSVTVEGEKSTNVFKDVAAIRETIHDEFHVPTATVRRADDEENVRIVVDFGSMTASSAPSAPMSSMLEASRLLAHREPLDPTEVDWLRGIDWDVA